MASDSKEKKDQQEIIRGFNQLRYDQRQIGSKISELEVEVTEHRLVVETLDGVEEDRKCFRMVGGILVERTVKEVLPALKSNKDNITKLIEQLKKQVEAKGKEIMEYKEKHNIQFRTMSGAEKPGQEETKPASQGVLVDSKS